MTPNMEKKKRYPQRLVDMVSASDQNEIFVNARTDQERRL